MSNFHDRTLALLGDESRLASKPIPRVQQWANNNQIAVPASYLEWAQLDGESLFGKFSNDDWFDFESPRIVNTPDGHVGLCFHSENQGNFDKIVLLDHGDDPPVLFAWIGEPPWVRHTERFSDCVFAQIFDWQYWLEFDVGEPNHKEMSYTGDIELRSDRSLVLLRERFEEAVTTQTIVDGDRFTEYRFQKSPKERLTVSVDKNGTAHIRIAGELDLVARLEAELLESLSTDIVPPSFNSVLSAADFLGSRMDREWIQQLRYAFLRFPSPAEIERLVACHKVRSLRERVFNEQFPRDVAQFSLGGSDWGAVLTFRRTNQNWWWLESVR